MKKITKKIRDEAATLCAGFASTRNAYTEWNSEEAYQTICSSAEASDLVQKAFWQAASGADWTEWAEDQMLIYAEAEAMLRCGWSP